MSSIERIVVIVRCSMWVVREVDREISDLGEREEGSDGDQGGSSSLVKVRCQTSKLCHKNAKRWI